MQRRCFAKKSIVACAGRSPWCRQHCRSFGVNIFRRCGRGFMDVPLCSACIDIEIRRNSPRAFKEKKRTCFINFGLYQRRAFRKKASEARRGTRMYLCPALPCQFDLTRMRYPSKRNRWSLRKHTRYKQYDCRRNMRGIDDYGFFGRTETNKRRNRKDSAGYEHSFLPNVDSRTCGKI